MTKFDIDEEASERLRMDVVHEIDDAPAAAAPWVDAMRCLNTINDPLGRRLLTLHRDCGSGTGECDSDPKLDAVPMADRRDWGCETVALIAHHHGVEYPIPSRPTD